MKGKFKLTIPGETQTDTVFWIAGEGITHLGGRGKGDEYVIIMVVTPARLSRREQELLQEFETLRKKREGGL